MFETVKKRKKKDEYGCACLGIDILPSLLTQHRIPIHTQNVKLHGQAGDGRIGMQNEYSKSNKQRQ